MPREELKQYRKSIKETQEKMAQNLQITLSFYKQIECGAKNPSIKTIKKFKEKYPTANIDKIFLS